MHTHHYQFIDPSFLMQTVSDDLDLFIELSTIFLTIAPPMFKRLTQAIHDDDSKVAGFESHALKGSTSMVGATQLSTLLGQVERHSRHNEPAMVRPCLPELTRLFDAVLEEINTSILQFSGNARQPAAAPGGA